MELYLKLIDVIVPVFFVIGIGYYLGKKNPDINTDFITTFAGNVGTPAMIFYTITTTGITLDIFIEYFIYALIVIGGFSFVGLLFFYKSQLKIWFGLYPFIIFHYIFFGYNLLCPLNTSKIIKRPHSGKLLYELRNFCNFKLFRNKTKFFLNDTR